MELDQPKNKPTQNLDTTTSADKVVDIAIARMKSDAIVKEDRNQKIKYGVVGAMILTGLVLFLQYDFKYRTPVSETSNDGNTIVTLKLNGDGQYLAKGKINGEPVNFLVDTGATSVAIPMTVARDLDLPLGRQFNTVTANGIGTGYETNMRSISLGDITLTGIKAGVSNGLTGDHILLGMSFLRRTRIETEKGVMKIIY